MFYIDYGNSERIPSTRLRPLPERFAEAPAQAIKCAMSEVKNRQFNNTNTGIPDYQCHHIS